MDETQQTQTQETVAADPSQDDRWEALQGSMTAPAADDETEAPEAEEAAPEAAETPEEEVEAPETDQADEEKPAAADIDSFMARAKEAFGVEEFTVKGQDGQEITGVDALVAMLPEVKILSDISKDFESGPEGARRALQALVMSAAEKYPAEDLREEWEAFDALDLDNLSPEGRVFAGALQLSLEAKTQLEAKIEEMRLANLDLVKEVQQFKDAPNLAKLVKQYDGRSNLSGDQVLALMKKWKQTDPVNAYIIEQKKGKAEAAAAQPEANVPETPRLAATGRPTGKTYDPDATNSKGDPLYSIEEMMRFERNGYAAVPGSHKKKQ